MKISKIQIISALTWGAAIMGCAYMLRGFENSADIINIIIAGATVHFLFLSELARQFSKTNKNKEKLKGSNH